MRFLILLYLACLFAGCSSPAPPSNSNNQSGTPPEVSVNKTGYFPGEVIRVSFVAGADFHESAWVGIFGSGIDNFGPKSINVEPESTHQGLQKRAQGVLKFQAPSEPGGYTARMYDNGSNGNEVDLASFNVDAGQYPGLGLSEEAYAPGGEIEVSYWLPEAYRELARVVIVGADTESGKDPLENALSHQEIEGKILGKLVFVAPEKPGDYDARLIWSGKANGGTSSGVTTASFVVK
jgi:hypothetical protein